MASGCVLSDPPEYGTVKQTPPIFDLLGAEPSVFKTIISPTDGIVSINVPFRSEDGGDTLYAALILDYPDGELKSVLPKIPGGTFEDKDRQVVMDARMPLTPGCHQLSLILTHGNNLTAQGDPIDDKDTAVATWFVSVGDGEAGAIPLSECPSESTGAP
jgi:hypothetical protein